MPRTRLKRYPGYAGVDEAGRGPLAGPVYAAAVILPERFNLPGLNDSKQLTANERNDLAESIKQQSCWSIAFATVEEIDRINILWATMLAMRRAIDGLTQSPNGILIDGNRIPEGFTAEAVVKGDAKVACIAAASILAKTERDRVMVELADQFPQYGFDRHFGYSTPEHFRALEEHGPCAIHRRSFAPCRPQEQLCLTFDA
ncbi:MAG TPA: ribonuclease HII [Fimbriimonadaceae bacterium]|nr:ribonuclease HII [Fimbriimonadaceae bacterium]